MTRPGGTTAQAGPAAAVVPPPAWRPVLAIAGLAGVVLMLSNGRYGYWGDELYYLAAGRHPDWGYADQPPLVPLLARAMDELFAGSLVGFRLPALLLTVAGIVVAALTARELGGGRRAQVGTAAAYATAPFLLGHGHLLSTNTVDFFLWGVALLLLVRWTRVRDDRLLLALGVVTAVALQAKLLIPVLLLAAAAGAAVFGPREIFRRPLLWVGAVVAAASAVPTILWQAANGWPQLAVADATNAEVAGTYGGSLGFVPLALFVSGLPVGAPLLCYGLWRLLRSPQLRPYRFLGVAVVLTTAFFVVTGGRYYYVVGVFALCWAAGAVEIERALARGAGKWWRRLTGRTAFAVAAVVVVLTTLPWVPVSAVGRVPGLGSPFAAEEIGWPQLADAVTGAYRQLPPEQQATTVVLGDTYRQAAAVERFAPPELRPAYSGSRGYWFLAVPPADTTTVLYVGGDEATLRTWFGAVQQVATVDNGLGIRNVNQGAPVWLCTEPRAPLPELWPELLRYPVRFNTFQEG
ncbi:hypothetical protein BJF78_14100 [Pseudonocardia sp. CNS-139]|nr:hypothetical protein BJF78_14100 [Pseudonocardia sp. CNS-139]